MKKLFLACIIITICVPAFPQFALTPRGFIVESDVKSNFIEIEFGEISRNELFKKTSEYFEEVFKEDGYLKISSLRNEQLTLDGLAEDAVAWRKFRKHDLYMDMDFTWNFKFRNGKLLVELPEIHEMLSGNLPAQLIKVKDHAAGGVYIYNKKEEIKYPMLKKGLEDFFNSHISALKHYIEEGDCGGHSH